MKGTSEINTEFIEFSIDNELARIVSSFDNECIIHANAKNKLGTIILTATYNTQQFTKEIKIIPLW